MGSGDVGLDAQPAVLPHVVLEQDPVGPGGHHAHAVCAGTHHGADPPQGALGRPGVGPCAVGPHPDLVLAVDPGHKAPLIAGRRRSRFLIGAVAAGQLNVDAAHQNAAGDRSGVGVLPQLGGVAIVQVLRFQHRHLCGRGVSAGQLHKIPVFVIISETVSRSIAVVVLQVGRFQLPGGDVRAGGGQPHPDYGLAVPAGGNGARGGGCQTDGQKGGGKLHKSFSHNVLHFSGFPVAFLLTTWLKPW